MKQQLQIKKQQKPVQIKQQKPIQPQQQIRNQKAATPGNANKVIIFDSGALISFSMNGMTDVVEKLKGIFSGKFIITSEVKKEVIDTPIKIRRFELEALKIKHLLDFITPPFA